MIVAALGPAATRQKACTVPGSGQAKQSLHESMMCSLRLPKVEAPQHRGTHICGAGAAWHGEWPLRLPC